MNQSSDRSLDESITRFLRIAKIPFEMVAEVFYGIRTGTLPWGPVCLWGALMAWSITFKLDEIFYRHIQWPKLRPHGPLTAGMYILILETSGIWLWALIQIGLKRRLLNRLRDVFTVAGLKNALGNFPGFIFDRPLDGESRVMRLTNALLPIEKFTAAKPALASGLHVFIDEIRDNVQTGTVDVLYAHKPMPVLTSIPDLKQMKEACFIAGMARTKTINVDLKEVPHILVAGETASGKSTFLRQVIICLYFNNPGYEFTLVDLKGGLEFTLFSGVKRIKVIATLTHTVSTLATLDAELERRMKVFADYGVKDIDALWRKADQTNKDTANKQPIPKLNRHVVVIDEIAELFLAGMDRPVKDIQKARAIVSRLARQGRAVGIHLILGTQRPDARALDTQIKANLPGKVCFQMADTPSSMVVLGNGRARDLPGIPGRAIWQRGLHMIEVQTPFIDPTEVETLLAPFKEEAHKIVETPPVNDQAVRG